jgi:hypothetical protein
MDLELNGESVELIMGVSGHRWVNESPKLLNAIDEVLEKIIECYSSKELVLVSPLAEGADRIVAKRAISLPNVRLIALLPFPMEEYLEDFSSKESEREFQELYYQAEQVEELPGSLDREEAYLELGKVLINQSDLVIAIWDGKPAKGKGGTEEVVQMAREQGMPLAWIFYEQTDVDKSEVSLDNEFHGKVILERFPGQE